MYGHLAQQQSYEAAMRNPPSAAQSLFPHLPSAEREPVQQRERSLADAMYPAQSREQRAWDERRKAERDRLLKNLRELRERMREDR